MATPNQPGTPELVTPIETVTPEVSSPVEQLGESAAASTKKATKKTTQEVIETLGKKSPSSANDKKIWDSVKDHPLYASWRDTENMEFPEKTEQIDKKTKNKDTVETATTVKTAEKNLNKTERQLAREKRRQERKEAREAKKKLREEKRLARKAKRKARWAKAKEKIVFNPLSRVWFGGKEAVKTLFSLPANIAAKALHVVGRPQSLFVGEMRSDLAKNTGRGFVNLFRTIAGTVYRPYRTRLPYENVFKDYGASFNPAGDKGGGALGKGLLWGLWSIPRIPAQAAEGVAHFIAETATGKTGYTHTANAFRKAFSLIDDKPAT